MASIRFRSSFIFATATTWMLLDTMFHLPHIYHSPNPLYACQIFAADTNFHLPNTNILDVLLGGLSKQILVINSLKFGYESGNSKKHLYFTSFLKEDFARYTIPYLQLFSFTLWKYMPVPWASAVAVGKAATSLTVITLTLSSEPLSWCSRCLRSCFISMSGDVDFLFVVFMIRRAS